MASMRYATVEDLLNMQYCNSVNLPENYRMNYYFYHLLFWPQISQVAEDDSGKVIGYVLTKIDDETADDLEHGHITSVAVSRSYRMLNVASGLLNLAHAALRDKYRAPYVSLHVRISNRAALRLYSDKLGYKIVEVDKEYYADKEDALFMKKLFVDEAVRVKAAPDSDKTTNNYVTNGEHKSDTPEPQNQQTPTANPPPETHSQQNPTKTAHKYPRRRRKPNNK